MILDSYQIPVAIFNGADGGESISFFQAPIDYQTSLDSNYAKLYFRLNNTDLKNNVRAILWSQGENTGGLSTFDDYKTAFLQLKDSWLSDYPNIEKFYIFQTKIGCGTPISKLKLTQEPQRQLAVEDPSIHIMSTSALSQYTDNCHFNFANGYETFATRIFELVQRDLYNGAPPIDIEPPMITAAFLSNSTSLVIETDASSLSMNLQPQDFQLNDAGSATIVNIEVLGSNIVITLSEYSGANASISYLGPPEGVIGNFINNSKGLELLCFHEYSIIMSLSIDERNQNLDKTMLPPTGPVQSSLFCRANPPFHTGQ